METIGDAVVCASLPGGCRWGLRWRGCSRPVRMAVVRKVQIPWNPEAGFGAVTWDGGSSDPFNEDTDATASKTATR